MPDFAYKSTHQIKKMSLEDMNHYYRQLREYHYHNHSPLQSRRIPASVRTFLVHRVLFIDEVIHNRKIKVLRDQHTSNGKSHIYAATHVGPGDIEAILSTINENAVLLQGDAGECYRNFDGSFLDFNGRICFDTGYQYQKHIRNEAKSDFVLSKSEKKELSDILEDRHIAKETCIQALNRGDNLLIFPEGAYNVSRDPLMPLFQGVMRIAIESESPVDVIPVALVRENGGRLFRMIIGENMDVSNAVSKDIPRLTDQLAQVLRNMLDELGRKKYSDDASYLEHLEDVFRKPVHGYTLDVALHSCRFKPDSKDMAVIQEALRTTSPERLAFL